MSTKFKKGDKVEAEWNLSREQPVWDFDIEGNHSGKWRTGIVTDDDCNGDGGEFIVKFCNTDGSIILEWFWPHATTKQSRDGWIRHLVERSLFCDEHNPVVCACDSFKLAWFGHEENCAWAKNNVKKFAICKGG